MLSIVNIVCILSIVLKWQTFVLQVTSSFKRNCYHTHVVCHVCVCVRCVYCRIIVFELLNNVGWNIIGYFSHLSVNICKTEIDCHAIHVSSHFRDSFLVSNHSHFNFLEIGRDLCLCIWVCWSLPGYNSVSSPASETWNTANPSWWHWRWRSCSCCAINFINYLR